MKYYLQQSAKLLSGKKIAVYVTNDVGKGGYQHVKE